MSIPPQIPEDAGRDKVRTLVRDLRDWLASLNLDREGESSPFIVENPADWSNTAKPPAIKVGTMREVPGTSLVDVWDGQGYQRMTKAYYDTNFQDSSEGEPSQAELEGE